MFAAASSPDALNLDVSFGMWAILGGVILVMTAFDLLVYARGHTPSMRENSLWSLGWIGVALAFGAQNMLRDLIAGTFIIFEDQLGVGDIVDLGVASGTVEEVTLRSTRLRDAEGVVWHVPNGEIHRVGNQSQQWSRAVVDVPISSGAELDRATGVIKTAADELAHEETWRPRILDAPEVEGVESFTLDSVTIRIVVKTAPSEQWRVARELRSRIKLALDAAGIASGADGPPPEPSG
jgi:small conductance mechanosensitive channel